MGVKVDSSIFFSIRIIVNSSDCNVADHACVMSFPITRTLPAIDSLYRVVRKNRIPSIISGITSVIQHRF